MIELRRRYSSSKGSDSPSFSRLPAEYKEVEYIQNTGDSYIVLDFKYADIKFKFVVTPDDSRQSMQMGYGGSRMVGFLKQSGVAAITPVINGSAQSVSIPSSETTIHTIEIRHSDAALIIDGVNAANGDSFTNDTIFSIFYRIPYTIPKMKGKMYVLQRNYGEGYIDQYIPCYRISDRKPGMYDIVNDVFYTNAGEGEFLYGPDVHYNIPPEYQQVEYLESTGTQYIKTDIKPPVNCNFEIESSINMNGHQQVPLMDFTIFGCDKDWHSYGYSLGFDNAFRNFLGIYFHMNLNYTTTGYTSFLPNKNDFYKYKYESSNCYINNELYITSLIYTYIDCPIYIFGLNRNGNATGISPNGTRIKRLRLYTSEDIADFIPCYRKEDKVAGMYDLVSGEFYTNKGTGKFEVGPDVIG